MSNKNVLKNIAAGILAALFLSLAGCGPDPFYVWVEFIEGVPETGEAGKPLALTGTIRPAFASNKDIIWSVIDAGTTGASISGNILNTAAGGIVKIRALIANGMAQGKEFTQDFKIVFKEGGGTIDGGGETGGGDAEIEYIASAAINVWPPSKNSIPNTGADSGGESVRYAIGDVSWSPADNPFKGETVYTAAVTLTADEGCKFPDTFTATVNGNHAAVSENTGTTVTISYTFEKTLSKEITGITIESPPAKMTYTHGEKLDLSGLAVILSFDEGTPEKVTYSIDNFNTYNISTVPAHDDKLDRPVHDGIPIKIHAGGKIAETGNLTVYKASAPDIIFPTASAITYGEPISASTLSGGTTGRGVFAWLDGGIKPDAGQDSYDMAFTPNDMDIYDYTNVDDWNATLKMVIRLIDIYINKAAGAGVSVPTVSGSPTSDSITVNAVTLQTATGQSIEYAISTESNGTGLSEWQSGTTFNGLSAETMYYVYARSVSNGNYNAGTASVNVGIDTAGGSIISPTGIEMVLIPAGTFQMGSPASEPSRDDNEGPQHSVTITSGFYMGKYQVTQEQYQAVMGTNPSYYHGGSGREPAAGETQGKRPVEYVSWYDALVFCNKLSVMEELTPAYSIKGSTDTTTWGTVPTSRNSDWDAVVIVADSTGYRLPTEAQWEYACRAGTTTAYNTGDTISDNTGWYNSESKTHQVGLKPANAWGLYDMHGNVWEWCWDWYDSYSSGSQTDPTGASSGTSRVYRGGGWSSSPEFLRSAYRDYGSPNGGGSYLGFRLVRP